MDTLTIKLRWRPERMKAMTDVEREATKQEVKEALKKAVDDTLFPMTDVQGWVLES